MPIRVDENALNVALGEVLEKSGANWSVKAEDLAVLEGGGRPDVLIDKPDGYPMAIEAKVNDTPSAHDSADKDARNRLGRDLSGSDKKIHAAMALVYPRKIRAQHGESLRNALQQVTFEYALLSQNEDGSVTRFPAEGWLEGDLIDLAILIHKSGVPASLVESLADDMEKHIRNAAGSLGNKTEKSGAVAKILGQEDDNGGQSRRMAMAVVANALIFNSILAESELQVTEGSKRRTILSPEAMRINGRFQSPSLVCDEWERILKVNYWPIFHKAREIVKRLSPNPAADVLDTLWKIAERMATSGAAKSHDVTGTTFQKLVADRQFLAAYYTRPATAALLAGLAMPAREKVGPLMRIGDFSCGTGTLLSTAYQRFSLLHEIHGGNPEKFHADMMSDGLVGLDVLDIAVHLTASMLAGSYPRESFAGECLLTMPYGEQNGTVHVGSLDFLSNDVPFASMRAAVKTVGGKGEKDAEDLVGKIKDNDFDLVIMNPPFTRATSHEGEVRNVPNPAFAAFQMSAATQRRMSARLKKLAPDGCGHGNAGMASYFVELGYRKTKNNGALALVLPLTALSGTSWEKTRRLWKNKFSSVSVVTTADGSSFSADTSIAECLFVGRKGKCNSDSPAHFVVLKERPRSTVEGEALASAIEKMRTGASLRKLESGPFGGSPLMVGAEQWGEMLQAPFRNGEMSWNLAGIADLALAQTAYRFGIGTLQFDDRMKPLSIPVCRMDDLCAKIGPIHRDLAGPEKNRRGMLRGPFEFKTGGALDAAAYPILWAHNQEREQSMLVEPDGVGVIANSPKKFAAQYVDNANRLWNEFASPVHYSCDLNFNSQRILAAATAEASLGGRAWPSVVLENPRIASAFVLWCNSTLAIMSHWWMGTRTQPGRATSSVTGILNFPAFDLSRLDRKRMRAADDIFADMKTRPLLPFSRIAQDSARAELDMRLFKDVLALDVDESSLTRFRNRLGRELSKGRG